MVSTNTQAADATGNYGMTEQAQHFDTLVLGLGRTGLSCINYLAGLGERTGVADTRQQPPGLPDLKQRYPDTPFFAGEFSPELLCRARRLVVSPGIAPHHPAVRAAARAGVEILGDVEIFCRNANAPLVAVTGSNGKSTVVSLLAQMLERAGLRAGLGGNIGTPALDLLSRPAPDYYVLELSSFQLETLRSHRPAAAAVLNVSADHLDRHESMEDYAQAKQNIYAGDGAMIINLDDETVRAMQRPGRWTVSYSLARPDADFRAGDRNGETWLVHGDEMLIRQSELRVHGLHNLANVLACLALGRALDLPLLAMLEAARDFSGLPHRCERVAAINGVDWINDSKGTNVGATLAALRGLAQDRNNIVLVAGGDGKGADFTPLAHAIGRHVKAVILTGKSAQEIAAIVPPGNPVFYATGMDAAVSAAARVARPGDTVLLSPACASTDMFRDFAERGDAFKHSVAGIRSRPAGDKVSDWMPEQVRHDEEGAGDTATSSSFPRRRESSKTTGRPEGDTE
ncbi:MAG: UDP-N-acetylmuramoyl-L-alanine--D-glutamate ligase [Gammaproteobacteria bacterium]|nr:UDP-N-acetylmuramoyl-L-alanine--D-glutamate ligase [Gammaproteobacteria bacterium]